MFPVWQLFYVSTITPGADNTVIQQILQGARRNNRQLDVTGCLLYSGQCFGQVLEGTREVVQSLVQRIVSDPRHRNVRILLEKDGLEREYGDWSMGFLHDAHLENALKNLTLKDTQPGAIAEIMGRMKPDTVMGALS